MKTDDYVVKADFDRAMDHIMQLLTKLESLNVLYSHLSHDFSKIEESFKDIRNKVHDLRSDIFSLPQVVESNLSRRIDAVIDRIAILEHEKLQKDSFDKGRNQAVNFTAKWGWKIVVFLLSLVVTSMGYFFHTFTNSLQTFIQHQVENEVQKDLIIMHDVDKSLVDRTGIELNF